MADLITLEEYKTAEGIQSPKEDLRIEALIPSVSQLVKTYCGNSLVDYYSTEKTEYINVNYETHIVQLTESPVNSITSVEERASYNESYTTLTTGSYDYYLDSATDSLYRTSGSGHYRNWHRGPGSVKVVYTAGYSAVPSDLKLAVYDLTTYYLRDEHKQRQTLAGATIQNQGSTSMRNNPAFPDHIKRVLDLYKTY
jgi:hypothetical protein